MNNLTDEFTICNVQKWVNDLFQDAEIEIPKLEENPACINLISRIISLNREAEKDAEEVTKTESYLADFYVKKNLELSNNFSEIIALKDLHPDICEKIKKISLLAVQMKLKEPTITNFLLSSSDLENSKQFYDEQEMINAFTLSKLSRKITDIIEKNIILERDIEILEKKVSKQETLHSNVNEKSKFFRIKGEEYKKRIKKTEKQLRSIGWKSNLSHNELVQRAETIQILEHKVNALSSKLESYQNLPPNEMLTRFKIEEAQHELCSLQDEFNELL